MRNAFMWKDSVGPNEARPGHMNGGRVGPTGGCGAHAAQHSRRVPARSLPEVQCLPVRAAAAIFGARRAWRLAARSNGWPTCAGVWGYWSTDGLGLFEYMLMVEELKTEPVRGFAAGCFV